MASKPLQFTTKKAAPSKITFGKISLGSSTTTPALSTSSDKDNLSLPNDVLDVDTAAVSQGFSTFSYKKPEAINEPTGNLEVDPMDDEEMNRVMGFSSFTTSTSKAENPKTKKTARNFDIKEMTDAIRKAKLQEMSEKAAETIPDPDDDLDDVETEERTSKPRVSTAETSSDEDDEEADKTTTRRNSEPGTGTTHPIKTKGTRRNSNALDDEDDTGDEGVSSEDDDEAYQPNFPVQFKTTLSHSDKPVTAFAVDPAGTRFATGSLDYEVKLWDFTGLKNRHAFRAMKPCESHVIKNLSYSNNGEALLIISGNCQAKVVNRDGIEILECVKGDQYIVDMARTKGHVAMLTGGQFNPKSRETFLTSSDDGTCRLWDVNMPRQHKTCVKLRGLSGMKNPATACCYGRDGNQIYAGGLDGCINMWDTRRKLVVPTATIKSAHTKNTDIFAICTSYSGKFVASRGEDAVVNIWDTRNFSKAIFREGDFSAKYNTTDLTFSPDDRHLLIPTLPRGTTGRDKDETLKHSELRFLRMKTFTVDDSTTLKFPKDIIIRAIWNHRINQMFFSFASGSFKISYDLQTSHRGALLCHGQKPKIDRRDSMDDPTNKIIITPNALPLFKTDRSRNKKREEAKARLDPIKSKRPELPLTAGTAGRVGQSGSTLSSYVIRNLGMSKSVKDDMDPREAILRYAKDAAENPIWITPAYQKNQPVPIFQKPDGDDEPEEKKRKVV